VRTLLLTALVLCIGCEKDAESSHRSSNSNFQVEKLFEYDGCTMYRFKDVRYRYFARCPGAVKVMSEHTESCGKSCTRTVNDDIETGQP
jgi:hypothetical protein